ncbi:hypothetical protein [Thalassotalea agarivorans]|uniref:Uncharacterized protein n=1 Tax=Thalassotalea agarivorans TaxID=349064 RepID=A0A1I0EKH9_THASX|nr:hypothetical protein [Thalassotalea agarivorans]SET45466.1 hypothetical protein SAMN05660429_01823 [Thalassotalea agarivorans]
MSAIWKNHGANLADMINGNKETQAHLYLEQLMLFPVDIQDRIIEEISQLSLCNSDAVAEIISSYTMQELR